jgi:hypothetical protein
VALHLLPTLAVYVDPGSGSMLLQLLLGGVSGVYVIFRLFKQKILGMFGIQSEVSTVSDHAAPQKEERLRPQA